MKAKTFGGVTYKTIMALTPDAIGRFCEYLDTLGERLETDYWAQRSLLVQQEAGSLKRQRKALWGVVKDMAGGGVHRLGGDWQDTSEPRANLAEHRYVVLA